MKKLINPELDFLTKHVFELTLEDGEVIYETLNFQRNGTIIDHANPKTLQTWSYDQDTLFIYEHDGDVLARFDIVQTNDMLTFKSGSLSLLPDIPVLLKVSKLNNVFLNLISRVFQFQIKNGVTLSRDFNLLSDFTIGGYHNQNERFWSIDETILTIYNSSYIPTATYPLNNDLKVLSGEFIPHNRTQETLDFELISLNHIVESDEISYQTLKLSENEYTFKIQNIVFSSAKDYETQAKALYVRGADIASTPYGHYIQGLTDFNTYLNTLSLHKWSNYSQAKSYFLQLKVNGKFKLSLVYSKLLPFNEKIRKIGYDVAFQEIYASKADDIFKRNSMNYLSTDSEVQKETIIYDVETQGTELVTIPVSMNNQSSLVGFMIDGEAQIYDGGWYAVVEQAMVRDIRLVINTTTFQKEDYILANIAHVQRQIFEQHDNYGLNALGAGHLFINVVDNGSTLDVEALNSDYIRVYPNPNVGGAGGFSRGMIETLNLRKNGEFDATHVIFMDDDIDVLTESFKRVYALLSLIKPEYQDYFIEGAMLDNIDGITQYEDTGFISQNRDIVYFPTKDRYNLTLEKDILRNDLNYLVDNEYGAWWFCTVPIKFIHENAMSLPIFYRGDDIEFSVRNQAKLITMNGVAVWHLPFYTKKSKALENYLVPRNSFIDQSINGELNFAQNVDYIEKYIELFKKEQRMFNYGAARQVLDALDDYLKGPDYIASLGGIETLKREGQYNEIFTDDIPKKVVPNLHKANDFIPLNPTDMAVFLKTDNGHGLTEFALNKYDDNDELVEVLNHDMLENPGKQFMRKRLFIYDTYNKTMTERVRNQEKYEVNEKRLKSLLNKFDAIGEQVAADYREAGKKFHTVDFWKNYLGLEG